jgi:hypothetical protein
VLSREVEAVDMNVRKAIPALGLFALLTSCYGDDPTGPVNDTNSGGTGNQTLFVQAIVDVDEVTGGFLTEFRVTVSDRNQEPVSEAEVVIEGGFAAMTLEEGSEGFYSAEFTGAASGTLKLRVQKDTMYVRDVVLGNIGIHAILEPEDSDTVPAGVPLVVSWVSDREAPFARLSTRDATFENVPDMGEFTIPDDENPARTNQRVELLRFNEVQIAGGLRDSYFRMEVKRTVEPVLVEELDK